MKLGGVISHCHLVSLDVAAQDQGRDDFYGAAQTHQVTHLKKSALTSTQEISNER